MSSFPKLGVGTLFGGSWNKDDRLSGISRGTPKPEYPEVLKPLREFGFFMGGLSKKEGGPILHNL